MPTISVDREALFTKLGRRYTEDEFDELCFEFGIELDEVTSEIQQIEKEQGKERAIGASDAIVYKIDIPANRYDLLCIEGLVQSLKVFLQLESPPNFRVQHPSNGPMQKLLVRRNVQSIRPFCVCAVLRNVSLNQDIYNSFIDLQDKLHQNIGRKRTLVSIGTHDLDTVQGPFVYDAQPPSDLTFLALNQTSEHSATELMDLYSKDSHLKQYLHIIKDSPVYPVIRDRNGVVLSMPPIINGDHSKIKLSTKNIFVEITATDLTKANITLDTIVSMFSCYCAEKFAVEPVEVVQCDGSVVQTPTLPYRKERVKADYLTKKIGVTISAHDIAKKLTKMCLQTEVSGAGDELTVTVPPTRSDVIHACDIVEDLAIGIGYDNIVKTLPRSVTIGRQQTAMKLSERVRCEVAACGFTEALTFSLCARDDVSTKMRQPEALLREIAVKIANPKTAEFQVVRTSLIPGLLKTLSSNRKMPLPLKLFELQEVVLKDATCETGARNERRLAAVHYNKTPGFEVIHGLVDRIMTILEFSWVDQLQASKQLSCRQYHLRKADDPSYFPGRCAELVVGGHPIGKLGVIHPEVLSNYELSCPVAAFELNVEHLFTTSSDVVGA